MSIDVHCHYLPESAVEAHRRGVRWYGTEFERADDGIPIAHTGDRSFKFGSSLYFEPMEERVRRMDGRGIAVEMLSILPPLFRYELPREDAAVAARDLNDELADLAGRFPGRFAGLATLPMQDVDAAISELERVHGMSGISGVTVGTHVEGANLDDDRFAGFFSAADSLGAFIFIHPVYPRAGSALSRYYLRNTIGNPLETTIAASSLMLSGRMTENPNMHVCLAHAGGYLASAFGRLDWSQDVRSEAGPAGARPSELIDRFFYDCIAHDESTLRRLVDVVGAGRVVIGTDFPADMGRPDAASEIAASSFFTDEEKRAILHENLAPFVERSRR